MQHVQPKARVRAPGKEIFGWAMFDFANQAYTLLIITVIFPVLFTTVIVPNGDDGYSLGNLLWSVALSISYLMVVLTGPILGAIMDFSASKKRFLFYSYTVTIIATAALFFVEPGMIVLGMVLLVISNYAYAVGESFIASFLPSLGPPEDLGKISGFGWALGYVGGLLSAGFVIAILGEPIAENFARIRWTGPFAAFFFLVAAIPTFLWLKEPGVARKLKSGETFTSTGFERLGRTIREIGDYRDLAIFFLSIFFAMGGIYIVVSFSFIYGDQVVGWDEEVRILMFLIVQVTAALGAFLFGLLQDKIGALTTYLLTMVSWFLGVVGIYALPWLTDTTNQLFGTAIEQQYMFLVVGLIAGTSLGSSQSVSRALVGIFTPEQKAAEFYGFWGLFNKIAGVFGIIGLGILQTQFGLENAILFCAALFFVAFVVALFVNVSRGQKTAAAKEKLAAERQEY
jgi:MFS transporter, UMF1 family